MRICISHRLSIIWAQKWFFGVLRVKMWKYYLLTPKRHYPAWIRVCWCIAWQNRFHSLSSRSVERFCVQRRNFKKLSGNFGYMGISNPWGDLDQMWLLGRYGGRNHVCNISWLSVKGCGCGERGKFAFSHRLHASPLQHWSHRVTVWSVWLQAANRDWLRSKRVMCCVLHCRLGPYSLVYGYLEIATEFGDRVRIWSFWSNLEMRILLLEIAIVFGIQPTGF